MDTSVTDLPPQAIAVIGLRLPSLDPRLSFAVVGGCAKILLKVFQCCFKAAAFRQGK